MNLRFLGSCLSPLLALALALAVWPPALPAWAQTVPDTPSTDRYGLGMCGTCVVEFSPPRPIVNEGQNAVFKLRRITAGATLTVNVEVLAMGNIIAPEERGMRTVTFDEGAEFVSFVIPTIADDTYDADGVDQPFITVFLQPGDGYLAPRPYLGGKNPYGMKSITVLDDDFPPGVEITASADETTVKEGESTTLTFTFQARPDDKPHEDAGTFTFSVTGGDSGDYTLSPSQITVPASAFEQTGERQPFTATATATFTAIDDGNAEEAEDFVISVARGDDAQESIELPDDLKLTIPKNDFPEFSIRSTYSGHSPLTENDGPIEFEITRDWTATSTSQLQVRVSESRWMIAGERDHTRTIEMAPTDTSRLIYVQISNDSVNEPPSTITAEILDGDGFMPSPTAGSARVEVQDDDFPWGSKLNLGADRTTLAEGQSVTLTFTFKTPNHKQPHSDTGTFLINVTGDGDDYSLSTTTISAAQSMFHKNDYHYVATSVVTFAALADHTTESAEQFTIGVTRGNGARNAIALPDDLTLTIRDVAPPSAPLSVTAQPTGTGEIDLSWQEPDSDGGSTITSYTVQWKEASDSWDTSDDVSEAVTTDTTYTITNLSPGVEYSVRVIATNSAGSGLASDAANAETSEPQPCQDGYVPPTPTDVAVTAVPIVVTSTILRPLREPPRGSNAMVPGAGNRG